MKWSLKLGRFAGVDVFVHWTFVLLLGWFFFANLGAGQDVAAAVRAVGFLLALFGCVVLHEYGHALAARRYGISTRDITLLPIGGVARLERMPENPRHELWVALAGPAVNVVIVIVLFLGLVIFGGGIPRTEAALTNPDFFTRLMWVNVFLAVFNLLPAFPMDGGRVLRALLASRWGRRRATQIAANVGQAMAIGFGVLGFMWNPFLIFIAIFVYLGAQAEAQLVELTSAIRGLSVRDAMQTRFRTLSGEDPLTSAVAELLAGAQHDFPVLESGSVVGMLRRRDLVKALADRGANASVADAMCHECGVVEANELLEKAYEKLQRHECSAMPVLEHGQIIGLLTTENISELFMVRSALERRHDAAPASEAILARTGR